MIKIQKTNLEQKMFLMTNRNYFRDFSKSETTESKIYRNNFNNRSSIELSEVKKFWDTNIKDENQFSLKLSRTFSNSSFFLFFHQSDFYEI